MDSIFCLESLYYLIGILILVYICVCLFCRLTVGICKSDADLTRKTVIVTGANAGIGYEVALDMAFRNAHVILACRNKQRGDAAVQKIIEETGNKNVELMILDLASLDSVRRFAEEFKKKHQRLDILINNAGLTSTEFTKTIDGYETTFHTNHLGPFLLTNLLLDIIKKSQPSRIINTSSLSHRAVLNGLDFENLNLEKYNKFIDLQFQYGATKLMNVLFTRELAKKLEGTGVTTNCLHPGTVASDFFNKFTSFTKVIIMMGWPFFKTSKEGAQTTIYLAVSKDVENVSGKYYSDCKEATISKAGLDDGAAKKLWEISEKLAKL